MINQTMDQALHELANELRTMIVKFVCVGEMDVAVMLAERLGVDA